MNDDIRSVAMLPLIVLLGVPAVVQRAAGVDPDQDRVPAAGYALRFEGEAVVRVPRSPVLEPDVLTIELWARMEGEQPIHSRFVRKVGTRDRHGYIFSPRQGHDQHVQFRFSAPTLIARDPRPSTDYLGAWHHFAVTYEPAWVHLYIDGVLVAEMKHEAGILRHDPEADLFIGFESFRGDIDEVRLWSRPRSGEEIRRDMRRPLRGDEPGLIAYFRFDEGQGQLLRDSSSSGLTGFRGRFTEVDSADPVWVRSGALLVAPGDEPPVP
jgi:hypothetical protein